MGVCSRGVSALEGGWMGRVLARRHGACAAAAARARRAAAVAVVAQATLAARARHI